MLNGILTVFQGVSRVDGVPLAICGASDPFGSATNFLAGRGLGNGSHVIVSGSFGTIGDTAVFCMTDVHAAAVAAHLDEGLEPVAVEETVVVTVSAAKPAAGAAGKTRKRTARKAAATKRGAKNTVVKKRAVKKTAAKKRTGHKQPSARKSSRRARKSKARAAKTNKGSRKR